MKSSKRSSSVYRSQNSQVRAVFERAGSARKVLCVALDYAKSKHVALICDGNGDILKAAFPVENSTAGVAHLIEQISATARRRKITKDCIYLGGEDEAAYVANFTAALRDKGYLVVRVNAFEAKESRENLLASTDNLDLLGVAKTLLARRARATGESTAAEPVYHHLREINRCRRNLVRQQTAASNRIHALADQLFPGFLSDPKRLASLDSLCAYAGIVPRTYQSGGPDSPAVRGHASPRCNRILKDWTVQSAQKIHLYGPPELKDRITRWNAEGKHGIFAGARRYLRLLRTLVLHEVPYLHPQGRGRDASPAELAAAAQATWAVLQRKWRPISGGLDLIADEAHPLGFWRRVVMETHGIHLPLRPS
jgi:transposase